MHRFFAPLRDHFWLILIVPGTLQIATWPSKMMLSCRREHHFQKIMIFYQKMRCLKIHQKSIQKVIKKRPRNDQKALLGTTVWGPLARKPILDSNMPPQDVHFRASGTEFPIQIRHFGIKFINSVMIKISQTSNLWAGGFAQAITISKDLR